MKEQNAQYADSIDVVDTHAKQASLDLRFIQTEAIATGGALAFFLDGKVIEINDLMKGYTLALAATQVLNFGINLIENSNNNSNRESARKRTLNSEELGYQVVPLIYQGDEIDLGDGKALKKDDGYLYVSLPKVILEDHASETNESSPRTSILNASLHDIQTKLSQLKPEHSAVVIDGYSFHNLDPEQDKSLKYLPRKPLLKGKKVEVPEPISPVIILTPEEFKEMALAPSELFEKAIENTGSTVVKTLVDLAKKSPTEDHEKITEMLYGHMDAILQRESNTHFNGATTKLSKDQPKYLPVKERVERRLEIREYHGVTYIQLIGNDGTIETKTLEKALKIDTHTLNEMVEEPSQFQKARSIYVLEKLLEEFSLDELINDPYQDPKKFIRDLKEKYPNLKIYPKTNLQAEVELVDRDKTWNKLARTFPKNISYPIGSAVAAGFFLFGMMAVKSLDIGTESSGSEITDDRENFNFSGKIGSSRDLVWKLESHDGMPTDGYYVVATTRVMEDSKWLSDRPNSQSIELPKKIDEGQFIKEEKFTDANLIYIPVKNDSRLAALSVTDKKGNDLSHSLSRGDDNTYQLVMLNNNGKIAHVEAYLVPSIEDIPQATGKIEPLDIARVSDDAKKYITDSKIVDGYSTLPDGIAKDFIYNVMPDVNKKLDEGHFTREKVVNLISESSECNCATCNTLQVLLSTIDDDNLTLNAAIGYIHQSKNPVGEGGRYITGKSRHLFALDDKGVVYDATGSNGFSQDKDTQNFIYGDGEISGSDMDKMWSKKAEDFSEDEEPMISQKALLMGLCATILGGIGLYSTRKTYKFLRRVITEENINKFGDDIVTSFYTEDELRRADGFFNGLSWSRSGVVTIPDSTVDKSGVAMLKHLKNSVNHARIDDYLDKPTDFEEGLESHEKMKMRFLAKYLIGRVY